MTAEIAILNKSAVALAADSAVTIPIFNEDGRSEKIYNTVNKLFTLSKYRPVGIMIHGDADNTGIPWETIIKMYRSKLGSKSYSSIEEYGRSFIRFIDRNPTLFTLGLQEDLFYSTVHSYYHYIRDDVDDVVEKTFKGNQKVTHTFVVKTTKQVIDRHYRTWEKAKRVKNIPASHLGRITKRYRKTILELRKHTFEKIPLDATDVRKLIRIAGNLFCKDFFKKLNWSGIVIAGFGEKETFPGLYAFRVLGVVGNRLKYSEIDSYRLGDRSTARVYPFAQREMVDTFMCGIHPDYYEVIREFLTKTFDGYPEEILKLLPASNKRRANSFRKKVRTVGKVVVKKFFDEISQYEKVKHSYKIMEAIAALPKEELASMAESLIYLTALRHRISLEAETVGGPIDVAIVSKGDGFVWIKRKHYFQSDLNPHFTRNYFHGKA